jgi:hypothetical protein
MLSRRHRTPPFAGRATQAIMSTTTGTGDADLPRGPIV